MTEHTCGECYMFRTPHCSFAFTAIPINPKPPKTVHSWQEFIQSLYDMAYLKEPIGRRKIVSNFDIIFSADVACVWFKPLSPEVCHICRKQAAVGIALDSYGKLRPVKYCENCKNKLPWGFNAVE